jgi:hypothetical protein
MAVRAFVTWAALASIAAGQTTITEVGTTAVSVGTQTRTVNSGSGSINVTYNGIEERVRALVSAGTVYTPTTVGEVRVRRNVAAESFPNGNANQTSAWNHVASISGSNHTVRGQYRQTMEDLFNSNNVATGTENLFVNSGDVANVASNVERMDYLFAGGLTASASKGFAVLERGGNGGGANGGFKIAAITAVDAFGNPANYGAVVSVATGSYSGNGMGLTSSNYDVFRFNSIGGPGLDFMHNANIGPQGLAGVFFTTSSLAAAGTTIYGYSLFGTDTVTTGSGASLVDWTDAGIYSTASTTANDLDLVASGVFVFAAVPEPGAMALCGAAGVLMAWRRRAVRRSA